MISVSHLHFRPENMVCPKEISFLKAGNRYLKAGNMLVSLN